MTSPNRHVVEAHRHIAQSYLTELIGQLSPDTPSQRAALAKQIVAEAYVEYKQRGSLLVLTFDLSEPAPPKD
jgi:hypothetical protein